jgi:hypothetical protein
MPWWRLSWRSSPGFTRWSSGPASDVTQWCGHSREGCTPAACFARRGSGSCLSLRLCFQTMRYIYSPALNVVTSCVCMCACAVQVLSAVARIIEAARERGLPLVVDADGLWLIAQRPALVRGYTQATLTPNAMEFRRLQAALELGDAKRKKRSSAEEQIRAVCAVRGSIVRGLPLLVHVFLLCRPGGLCNCERAHQYNTLIAVHLAC